MVNKDEYTSQMVNERLLNVTGSHVGYTLLKLALSWIRCKI